MGISGLLPALRPIEQSVELRQYAGKTVAIDGNCILHRGAIGAAKELALNKPTDAYVTYFMTFMALFKYYNVTPIVVFDGLDIPLKQDTNDERRSNRQEALKEGLRFDVYRNKAKARECFKKSVTITNDMIIDVLRKLSAEKIQCIVAPNEADAQLTHLAKTGKVDAVITEDSNLLAFGCPRIIYKMNLYGQGTEITMDQVINNENSVFYNYDLETIRHICILSGCDYLPSIKQVSFTTILNTYKRNNNTDRALYNLQYKYKDIPRGYFEKFYLANLGFLHQWVYDIDEKNYVRLNPLPKECSDDDIELLGRIPTVQDSTMFRVNEIIPKAKPKDNPQNNDGNSPVMNALDIRSSESSPSMPKVLTQSDRLETFYTKFHVFPRKSQKAIVESATPSMTAISENANSTPQSFSYDDRYALPTTSAIPSAELTQSNGEVLQIWKFYQENKPIPHHDVLRSTVEQASQNTECTTTMHKPSSSLKRSVSFFHEPLMDHDDTPEFSLPAPSSPTAPVNQSLSPPFTASETAVPENADSESPPSTLTVENEQLSSSISDTVSSPATATQGGQTSKSPNKKKTGPRLTKLHRTVKQAYQNMKNTRTIHKPSSLLKRLVSYYHESLKDHDDTPEFSLPAPSWPTAPANQPLSPPFTASETAVPENADSGSPPSTLTTETEQLSSSIPDTVSSPPATATRSSQASISLNKKKIDSRLAELHSTVKQASQNMKNTRTIYKPSSSLKRSVDYFHESRKIQDYYFRKFSSPASSPPSVPAYFQTMWPTFTAAQKAARENSIPETAHRTLSPSSMLRKNRSIFDTASSSFAMPTFSPTSKYSVSYYRDYSKDQVDTQSPENARRVLPPFNVLDENGEFASPIFDTVSSSFVMPTPSLTSRSLNKKKTDSRLAELHSTVKQASQNMKNTRTIHKPSSPLKRSFTYFHESWKDQDDTPEFSLPAPSRPTARVVRSLFPPFNVLGENEDLSSSASNYYESWKARDDIKKFSLPAQLWPTAPANKPLSPPFTASENVVPENADSGSPPSTLTTETEQLSSSIPDIVSSPATATRSGQTPKSPNKKRSALALPSCIIL